MKIKRHSDAVARSFKMRLCHISDTHGGFPRLPGRYDVVIHTGDFFPNSRHVFTGNKTLEMVFQDDWLKSQIATMKSWLQGHPFLYVPGNHDFLHSDRMEHVLRSEGINAIGLTDKVTTVEGVNFYGFPYVPYINGSWNYERELPEMQQEVDKMVEVLNKTFVDVLACHAPPYKALDLSLGNEILGSTVIANALDYKIARDMLPPVYLCGHIHEAHGITLRNGVLMSNAAVTQHIIEV
jgi:Icc-related predicted phosphoesterase